MTYIFSQLTHDHLPMIAQWLRISQVTRWWGEPSKQLDMVTEDLNEPLMRQWIVSTNGQPFAYAQAYPVHAWPQAHLSHLPQGAQAIDTFIGVPEMFGWGHGSGYLNVLANHLITDGATAVAIDPAADNERAIRSFKRAGFHVDETVQAADGLPITMVFSGI